MKKSVPSLEGFRFGVFEIDLRSGELLKNGRKLRVQQQPFEVLAILAGRAGELVTRDEFRNSLWANNTFVDFDQSLNIAINKIRQVLGDSAENPTFIETLPKRGYRFIVPVTPLPAIAEAASPAQRTPKITEQPSPTAGSNRPRRIPWLYLAASVGGLALELNPNYATAHEWYGGLRATLGHPEDDVSEHRRAQELDPLSLIINRNLGQALSQAGNNEQAIEQLRKTIEFDPSFPAAHLTLSLAYLRASRIGDAVAEAEKGDGGFQWQHRSTGKSWKDIRRGEKKSGGDENTRHAERTISGQICPTYRVRKHLHHPRRSREGVRLVGKSL